MNQEFEIEDVSNQERVIKHLRREDWLLIVLPMVLVVILLIIYPLGLVIIERASGNPTEVGGFNYDGLVIIAGIFLCSIFCGGYGVLAFILSLLTRRNITFRILLIGIPLLTAVTAVTFYGFLLWREFTEVPL